MNTLQALVVDDEPLARQAVLSSISQRNDIEVIAQCGNGAEAIQAIETLAPDVVFLDIQMPGINGFEVIETIQKEQMPYVIFITAYDEYAIQAFEKQAVDYLLKPFTHERFCEAVERILVKHRANDNQQWQDKIMDVLQDYQSRQSYIQRVIIRSHSKIYFVHVENIQRIQSAGNYVEIFTDSGSHLLRETMTNLENKLDPNHFMRIHRTSIVHIKYIQEIQPDGEDYLVLMKDGAYLPMSKTYKSKFNKEIGDYM